jgi:uncharacterized protein YprB with RNaseH-like and TPR domain
MSGLKERLNRLKPSMGLPASNRTETLETQQNHETQQTPETQEDHEEQRFAAPEGLAAEPDATSAHAQTAASDADTPVNSAQALSFASTVAGEVNEWAGLDAGYVTNEWGSFIRRRRSYPLTHRHGCYQLGDLASTGARLGTMSADLPPDSLEKLLYFDTETTGLGHGAGNLAFMLGLGFYQHDRFVIEQLFIRNPAEELAMLAYFSELASCFTHLVTYNGKSFDWPLLQSRYVMNRLTNAMQSPRHLDFLHPSRSLWKHTLPSVRLGKVEEEQLGFCRVDDLPGSLAPVYYFRYLAERDPQILQGVFIHNEYDLLSMVGLSIHFSRALSGLMDLGGMVAEEVYRLGLWFARMEEQELAEEAFQHLLMRDASEAAPYWTPIAAYEKKRKNINRALALWQQAADYYRDQALRSTEPLIELAMYHEHKSRNFDLALSYAEEALICVRRRSSYVRLSAKDKAEIEAISKRVERLRSRASRAEEWALPILDEDFA